MVNKYQINRSGALEEVELDRKKANQRDEKKKSYNLLVNHAHVGYYLVAPLLIGVFLGLYIDERLHTKPVFVIMFLLAGSVATFYNLYRTGKR